MAPQRIQKGNDPELLNQRNQLIIEHLPQVKMIARRIHASLPVSVPLDDLISSGTVGLIDAVDRYNTTFEVKIEIYAKHRIRGAILDSLRALDWAPREKRRHRRLIQTAICSLEHKLGRHPDEQEVAEHLQLSMEEYRDWLSETRFVSMYSVSSEDGEGEVDLQMFVPDSEEQLPSRLLERAELKCYLAHALDELPGKEGTVLSLYFYDELTLRAIAEIIGVTESRASQLKTQGIKRLRTIVSRSWCYRGMLPVDAFQPEEQEQAA